MKSQPVIPIPASVRWREFRLRVLPWFVFLSTSVAIYTLWRGLAGGGVMAGIGEGVRSVVTAPQPARIKQWLVEPYSVVTAGTPLAVVVPVDPRADFDHLRSLLAMAQAASQPSLAEDNAMNFERIRVELLRTKSELAIARVNLEQAERDVARNTPLYREKLLAQDIYELSLNTREALQTEVAEKSNAVAQIERRLEDLRPLGEPGIMRTNPAAGEWLNRLETARAAAARNLEPLTLVAPITGMVDAPRRQAGEFVLAGEPLLSVSAVRSDRIIAYLRQPYRLDPKIGMTAQVTTRTRQRQTFVSRVIQVGAQVEVLTNSLAFLRPGSMVDVGLPVVVEVPLEVTIRPGEVVDVAVLEASADPAGPLPAAEERKLNAAAAVD